MYTPENSILIQVPGKAPVNEADSTVRYTIRFVKDASELTCKFQIRSAAPTLITISNTLPTAVDTIMIYGTGLTEINKITFPGGVAVTAGIVSDLKGTNLSPRTYFLVVVYKNGLCKSQCTPSKQNNYSV